MTKPYTPEMLAEFDRLTEMNSSRDQVERIRGRLGLRVFIKEHGRDVCDEMWKELIGPKNNRQQSVKV